MKLQFGIAIVLGLFLVGCKKSTDQPNEQQPESQIRKESLATASMEERRAYVRENLKIIMTELGQVMKEPNFRGLIHSKVADKFDGDYNVLVKTLLSDPVYGARLNTERMQRALNAFKNLEGQNFYPQIYIPSFKKQQEETIQSNNAAQVVFFDGNEAVTEVPGYVYNETGELVPSGIMVNEEYSLQHEVYIISLNESVDNEGELSEAAQRAATLKPGVHNNSSGLISGIKGVSGTKGIMAAVNFWIDTIYLKTGKESWLAGASEVNIKSEAYTWNMRDGGSATGQPGRKYTTLRYVDNTTNNEGFQIVKADRGEVKWYWNINYPLNTNWLVDNPYTDPIAYAYVIFEYDAYPAAVRTNASLIPSSSDPNLNKCFLNYRSSDPAYGGEITGQGPEVNYAIYGNVYVLPSNLKNLYYNPYRLKTSTMDFSTEKY